MKREKVMLKTVTEVVDAFGGPNATARWAGHGPSAVCNWMARGFIPPGWHYRMSKWAAENGYEISPSVFGEEETERPKRRQGHSVHV
jgi:hypothetical protein